MCAKNHDGWIGEMPYEDDIQKCMFLQHTVYMDMQGSFHDENMSHNICLNHMKHRSMHCIIEDTLSSY